jgi:hypothetical protein
MDISYICSLRQFTFAIYCALSSHQHFFYLTSTFPLSPFVLPYLHLLVLLTYRQSVLNYSQHLQQGLHYLSVCQHVLSDSRTIFGLPLPLSSSLRRPLPSLRPKGPFRHREDRPRRLRMLKTLRKEKYQ